jgi:hypothetical protein
MFPLKAVVMKFLFWQSSFWWNRLHHLIPTNPSLNQDLDFIEMFYLGCYVFHDPLFGKLCAKESI